MLELINCKVSLFCLLCFPLYTICWRFSILRKREEMKSKLSPWVCEIKFASLQYAISIISYIYWAFILWQVYALKLADQEGRNQKTVIGRVPDEDSNGDPILPASVITKQWGFEHQESRIRGFPWWLSGNDPTCQCRRHGFDPWVRKTPWGRKWQPTPVFLPGKSHGQSSLEGHSPWGRKRVGHNLAAKQQQGRWLYPVPAHGPRRSGPFFHSPREGIL